VGPHKGEKMTDCIFCKIAKGEIPTDVIYEDEHAFAFPDAQPNARGHTLIIPKKHFSNMGEMTSEDFANLSNAITKISKGILNNSDGMNIFQNNGKIAGQVVNHVHFHLMPRFNDDGSKFEWKRIKEISEKDNKEFIDKIKSFLK